MRRLIVLAVVTTSLACAPAAPGPVASDYGAVFDGTMSALTRSNCAVPAG